MLQENIQYMPYKFYCDICDYGCCKNFLYNQHTNTSKHKNATKMLQNATKICQKNLCECGKQFQHHSSYYRHKKKCSQIEEKTENEDYEENEEKEKEDNEENNISPEIILNIIQQNQEFKDLLLEQNKLIIELSKNSTTNINNSMNNSHNKTFNLQFFLNETCKDAMNIMDFVDSIKIQLSDIESIGELGYVNGMSKLIIKHLNALDENMRPVHCSDPKRDSLYVKDKNVWEKEDPDNKKIKKAIKYISHKNICALPEWKKKYPDCIYSDSLKSDQYNHIVLEAMGGSGDNDIEKADKIVKKIAKVVTIDKNN
jgi:hypothetical protein